MTRPDWCLIAALVLSVALVFVAAAGSTIGFYAKWNASAPFTVTVSYGALPSVEQPIFETAMASWSASPTVDFAAARNAKVKVVVDTLCSPGCTVPNYSNGRLHSAVLHFDPAIFAWDDEQWVFCHELGHALGLGEGYPVSLSGDYGSCMAGSTAPDGGLTPSEQDFDVLVSMYDPAK